MGLLDITKLQREIEQQRRDERWETETHFAIEHRVNGTNLLIAGFVTGAGAITGLWAGATFGSLGYSALTGATMGALVGAYYLVTISQPNTTESEKARRKDSKDEKYSNASAARVQAQPVVIQYWQEREGGYKQAQNFDLGFDLETLQSVATHTVLNGREFNQRSLSSWVNSNQYQELSAKLLDAGILYQVDRRGKVAYTAAGKRIMHRVLSQKRSLEAGG